jgi:uncharacterized protein
LWKKGDIVQVLLPMHNSIEQLPNVPNYIAFMHGPVLLGAKTGTEDLAGLVGDDGRWGHIAHGKKLPLDKAPIIIEDNTAALTSKLTPVTGKPVTFTAPKANIIHANNTVFEPFYKIHDSRYMIYWMALSPAQYHSFRDSMAVVEEEKMGLEKRTIDAVAPGEQQPEVDHAMQKLNSNAGSFKDEFWRDAKNEGYFSYNLATGNKTSLQLMVRYWGAERGNRKFDIYIDDEKLVTEDITGKWDRSQFKHIEYAIPDAMVKDKSHIRVKFQALNGTTAGAVYAIRLLTKKE